MKPDFSDLQTLFDLSVDILVMAASDSRMLAVNPAFVGSFGFTEEEALGRQFLTLVHPEEMEKTIQSVSGLARGESVVQFENRCVMASGEVRWFQWSARADATSGRTFASGRDVTNQHKDADRLQRYADLLEKTQRELKEALDELTRTANTDQLTGLMNRRAFETRAAEELGRCIRNQKPIGLALFDIDRFKSINDEHGHPVGDVVLREVARRFEAARRPYDLVARWGGEEFVAVFPETSAPEATAAAERIALSVAARPVLVGRNAINVRISGGVVSVAGSEVIGVADLVAAADEALNTAKKNGRDRIEVGDLHGNDGGNVQPLAS